MAEERLRDNIWDFYTDHWIVITTNIGWKKDDCNPMGAGIAKAAAKLYPGLDKWYGLRCKEYKDDTAVIPYKPGRLILFPTKPLDKKNPHLSWKGKSTIILIEKSLKQLTECINIMQKNGIQLTRVGVPLVGCQNGGLNKEEILPLIHMYLDNRFVIFG